MRADYKFIIQRGRLLASLQIILFIVSCGQLSRDDLMTGDFGTIDKTPPKLIAPADNAQIIMNSQSVMTATLTWEVRSGATFYSVEIATDESFLNPVTNSPIMIKGKEGQPPSTIYEFVAEQPITYYWRVRASITEAGAYSQVFSFHAMDKVYVYCKPDVSDCKTGQPGFGNRTFPFAGVNQGIQFAKDNGLKNVLLANRGSSLSYNESVQIENGINILGGYTSDFTESARDIVNNRARIASSSIIMAAESITQATVIEGLYLAGVGTTVHGIAISGCTSGLRIQSNSIHLENLATNLRSGIQVSSSGTAAYNGPIIEKNKITLGDITQITGD